MRHLSLFTGSGIGDYAAEQCGIETVAQCEIDDCCRYCLGKMFPKAVQYKDGKNVSVDALRDKGLLPIDLISGGFPCQDLSTAGRGEGIEGGRSGLWREMFRIIRQVRPAWLVIENVPVIRLRGVDRVIAPLERLGYTCWPLVVGAWAVGAPHKRDRVWIVCHANGSGPYGQTIPARSRNKRAGKGNAMRSSNGMEKAMADSNQGGRGRTCADGGEPDAWPNGRNNTCGCSGDAVADAEQDGRGQGAGKPGNETETRSGRGELAGGVQLADATPGGFGTNGGTRQRGRQLDLRWPSHPGEPQHDWEAPRLTQCSVGDAVAGLAARLRSRTNKALLKMAGNGWCYPNALLIYQWISETEKKIREQQ